MKRVKQDTDRLVQSIIDWRPDRLPATPGGCDFPAGVVQALGDEYNSIWNELNKRLTTVDMETARPIFMYAFGKNHAIYTVLLRLLAAVFSSTEARFDYIMSNRPDPWFPGVTSAVLHRVKVRTLAGLGYFVRNIAVTDRRCTTSPAEPVAPVVHDFTVVSHPDIGGWLFTSGKWLASVSPEHVGRMLSALCHVGEEGGVFSAVHAAMLLAIGVDAYHWCAMLTQQVRHMTAQQRIVADMCMFGKGAVDGKPKTAPVLGATAAARTEAEFKHFGAMEEKFPLDFGAVFLSQRGDRPLWNVSTFVRNKVQRLQKKMEDNAWQMLAVPGISVGWWEYVLSQDYWMALASQTNKNVVCFTMSDGGYIGHGYVYTVPGQDMIFVDAIRVDMETLVGNDDAAEMRRLYGLMLAALRSTLTRYKAYDSVCFIRPHYPVRAVLKDLKVDNLSSVPQMYVCDRIAFVNAAHAVTEVIHISVQSDKSVTKQSRPVVDEATGRGAWKALWSDPGRPIEEKKAPLPPLPESDEDIVVPTANNARKRPLEGDQASQSDEPERGERTEAEEADTEAQQAELDEERADVEAEQSAVDEERADIEAEQSAVDEERADVEAQQTDADERQTDVESKRTEIDADQSAVDDERDDIAAKQAAIDDEQSDVTTKQTDIDEEQNEVDANQSADQGEIDAEQSEIDAKQAAVDDEQNDVDAKQADVNAEQSDADAKQAEVDAEREEAEEEQSSVEAAHDEADAEKTEVEERQTDIDAKRVEIDERQTDIDAEKTEVEERQTDIDAKQTEAEQTETELTEAEPAETEAEQTEVERTEAEQTEAEQTDVEPVETEAEQTEVEPAGQTEAEQTEAEQTEAERTEADQTDVLETNRAEEAEQTESDRSDAEEAETERTDVKVAEETERTDIRATRTAEQPAETERVDIKVAEQVEIGREPEVKVAKPEPKAAPPGQQISFETMVRFLVRYHSVEVVDVQTNAQYVMIGIWLMFLQHIITDTDAEFKAWSAKMGGILYTEEAGKHQALLRGWRALPDNTPAIVAREFKVFVSGHTDARVIDASNPQVNDVVSKIVEDIMCHKYVVMWTVDQRVYLHYKPSVPRDTHPLLSLYQPRLAQISNSPHQILVKPLGYIVSIATDTKPVKTMGAFIFGYADDRATDAALVKRLFPSLSRQQRAVWVSRRVAALDTRFCAFQRVCPGSFAFERPRGSVIATGKTQPVWFARIVPIMLEIADLVNELGRMGITYAEFDEGCVSLHNDEVILTGFDRCRFSTEPDWAAALAACVSGMIGLWLRMFNYRALGLSKYPAWNVLLSTINERRSTQKIKDWVMSRAKDLAHEATAYAS